jgi:hypothetical protein
MIVQDGTVIFDSIRTIGTSRYLLLSPAMREYLDLTDDESQFKLTFTTENGGEPTLKIVKSGTQP